jgi:hypothetical protein
LARFAASAIVTYRLSKTALAGDVKKKKVLSHLVGIIRNYPKRAPKAPERLSDRIVRKALHDLIYGLLRSTVKSGFSF